MFEKLKEQAHKVDNRLQQGVEDFTHQAATSSSFRRRVVLAVLVPLATFAIACDTPTGADVDQAAKDHGNPTGLGGFTCYYRKIGTDRVVADGYTNDSGHCENADSDWAFDHTSK